MSLRRWITDIVLAAAGIVSVLLEPASIAVHSIIGLVFAAAVGPHLWHRRAWLRGVWRRLRGRRPLSRAMRWALSQAGLLFLLAAVVTASGLYDWLDARTRIRWHAISSVILIGVAARHAWTRRRWLTRDRRRQPAPGHGAGEAAAGEAASAG
jgi:hypothetical protein